jgi:hypothetical protein
MQAYRLGTGKDINDYNRDCFKPALDDPKLLARYAYPRRQACRGCLLHDVPDPERYYRHHGAEVAALLRFLGIDLVVHGHRPERSGTQVDYEHATWLPGIRMISGDIQLRSRGLGATLLRQADDHPPDLLFINRSAATAAQRSDARTLLRAPASEVVAPAGNSRGGADGRIFEMILDDTHGVPAATGRVPPVSRLGL